MSMPPPPPPPANLIAPLFNPSWLRARNPLHTNFKCDDLPILKAKEASKWQCKAKKITDFGYSLCKTLLQDISSFYVLCIYVYIYIYIYIYILA